MTTGNWQVYAKSGIFWRSVGEPTLKEQAESVVAQMKHDIMYGVDCFGGKVPSVWANPHCVPV